MKQIPVKLAEAIRTLKLETEFDKMDNQPDQSTMLDWFKDQAERKFKRLAMKAHPDRGGSTKAMQKLNSARDVITSLNVARRAPAWAMPVVQVFAGFGFTSSTTTSSTTTARGTGQIFTIRFGRGT